MNHFQWTGPTLITQRSLRGECFHYGLLQSTLFWHERDYDSQSKVGCLHRVFCRLAGLRLEELTLRLLSMAVSLFQIGVGKEGAVIHKGVICAGSVVLEVNEKRLVVVNVEKKAVLNVSGIEHKQVLDLSDDGKVMC